MTSVAHTGPLGVRNWGVFGSRPSGCSVSVPPSRKPEQPPAKRGRCIGWTRGSAARHAKFLQSVDMRDPAMHGSQFAFTLTVRSWPASSEEWQRLRRNWLKRVERLVPGVRWHWVMETQLRGAPHLHGALLVPQGVEVGVVHCARIVQAWCEVAAAFRPSPRRQKVERIGSAEGWARYVAKHSARSAGHAQRRDIPPGWETTGRLWGHSAGWTIRGAAYRLSPRAVVEMRRLLAGWRRADAATRLRIAEGMPCVTPEEAKLRDHRIRSAKRAIVAARAALQGKAGAAAVRGLREWVDEDVQLVMLRWVARLEVEADLDGVVLKPACTVLTEDQYQTRRAVWLQRSGILDRADRRLNSMRSLGYDVPDAEAELHELLTAAGRAG